MSRKWRAVNVQRAGHDDAVDIFHVEQAAVIVESLNAGHSALRLVAAAAVDVGHRHQFDAMQRENLPQQIVAAIAHADHAHANAVVRAQHVRSWIRQHGCGSQRGLLQKSAPALREIIRSSCFLRVLLGQPGAPFLARSLREKWGSYNASASCRSFFIPAQLLREHSSGEPPPFQCVSRLTAIVIAVALERLELARPVDESPAHRRPIISLALLDGIFAVAMANAFLGQTDRSRPDTAFHQQRRRCPDPSSA